MSRWLVTLFVTGSLITGWASAALQNESATTPLDFPLPSGAPADVNLPQIGEPADTLLSPTQEFQLGSRVVSQFYAYEYVLEDAQLTDYLSATGWRLAAASGTRPAHLEFFMVKDSRINAFALPGGFMGFNAGLLTASSSESELAGVMAHELAHVTQRHIARSASANSGLSTIATWAAVLAAIIAGSADPDLVIAALSIGQASAYQRQVNYTRAHELEADRIGINTLSDAGFSAEGMASFFQKLEQQSRLYGGGVAEILRTHPVNTTRISEARSRAAALPKQPVADSIEYSLMRARTQVFAADQPSDAVDAFSALIAAGQDTPGNRYGLAFALHQLGQNDRALKNLAPTLAQFPRQPNLSLLHAAVLMAAGDVKNGLATYEKTLATYPRFAPAILEYAEALIQVGEADQARQVLLSYEQALGTRLDTYRLLSQAAREMKNDAEASFQMANFLFLRGDPGGALAQLDAGLRIEKLSAQDRARLSARRAEVRAALPKNFDPARDQQQRR